MITPPGPTLKERQADEAKRYEALDAAQVMEASEHILLTLWDFEKKLENKQHNLTVISPQMVIEAIKEALLGDE